MILRTDETQDILTLEETIDVDADTPRDGDREAITTIQRIGKQTNAVKGVVRACIPYEDRNSGEMLFRPV